MGGRSGSDPWARGFGDMPIPALCPGHAQRRALPSTDRLPSTVSAADVTRLCSRLPACPGALCFWLQADIRSPEIDFRLTPNNGHSEAHAGLPLLTQAVWKLSSRRERATLIRITVDAGNNDSRTRNFRVYCCANALPTRVFTQSGPKADIARHETHLCSAPRARMLPAGLRSFELPRLARDR